MKLPTWEGKLVPLNMSYLDGFQPSLTTLDFNFKPISMKNIRIIFILLLGSFACEETIDWSVDSDEIRLVVEGRITNELKVHQIKLTETSDYFNPADPRPVRGATVSIFDGDNTLIFTENTPGIYESVPFSGEVGRTYDLSIRLTSPLAEEISFSASSNMMAPPVLDSLTAINVFDENAFDDEPSMYTSLSFWGTGNLELDNAYIMEVYQNDQLETDSIDEVVVFNDEFLNEDFEDFEFYAIDEPQAEVGDSITLIMHTVEHEFADFYEQLLTESEPRDPFGLSSPPANVTSNVSGSALGYFYVSSVDTIYALVRDDLE